VIGTMHLHLLRHGIAVKRNASRYRTDAERPLAPEGRQKLVRIARALHAMELEFDLILSSPAVRARETAELVVKTLGTNQRIEFSEHLGTDGDPRRLIEDLSARRPLPRSALLVGHEPHLSGLASLLLTGGPGLDLVLKKGGLCTLSISKPRAGRCAGIDTLLTPRQMALMG